MQGLSAGEVLDAVITEAQRAGLLVMLDMHHLAMSDGITELWYNERYPESTLVHAWELLVKRHAPALRAVPCERVREEKCTGSAVHLTARSGGTLSVTGKQQ